MKFFKQNPVFSALLSLFILLFIGGVVLIFIVKGQVDAEKKSVSRAEMQLNSALTLEPAPTEANIEAAKANVAELEKELEKRIESTKGKKPTLLSGTPPANGPQMLFQLRAYRSEFAQVAERTIPVNLSDEEVKEKEAAGEPYHTTIPADFAFGFSRYLENPPEDKDVPLIFKQKEILNYILRKLFNTRPVGIINVQREPVEIPVVATSGKGNTSNKGNQSGRSDEFRIGTETARVEGAVETLAFKIVFTGISENLRSFLKQIEEFEIPLVVRSVEVVPLESSVNTTAAATVNKPSNPFEMFGLPAEEKKEAKEEEGREPIVSVNISEFTVVLEYITVNISKDSDDSEVSGEEDPS